LSDAHVHKEKPVIPANMVVNKKNINGKMEGRGGGEAKGVAGHEKFLKNLYLCVYTYMNVYSLEMKVFLLRPKIFVSKTLFCD
jgi:hypothetical protein